MKRRTNIGNARWGWKAERRHIQYLRSMARMQQKCGQRGMADGNGGRIAQRMRLYLGRIPYRLIQQ